MRFSTRVMGAIALGAFVSAAQAQEKEPKRDVKRERVEVHSGGGPGRTMLWVRGDSDSTRAVLGITLGGTHNKRDTLGVFVSGVTSDGPADKAGIEEGNRIAAINEVNLRVAAEDADDEEIGSAKARRFTREMRKVKPGDNVSLSVYANGQFRTVQVKAAKASELAGYGEGFRFFGDESGMRMAPMPSMPQMPRMDYDRMIRPGTPRPMLFRRRPGDRGLQVVSGQGEGYALMLPGLRVTSVSNELASYFGAGSEKGLLVLNAEGDWDDLRAGDVILKIDGKSVRSGNRAELSLDMDDEHTIELIRKGKTMTARIGNRE